MVAKHPFRKAFWPITVAPLCVLLMVDGSPAGAAAPNGISSKSAAQIVSTAIKTSAAASSFSVDGSVTQSGSTVSLDLSVSSSGRSEGTTIDGGTAHVVELGPVAYFKADNSFWSQNGNTADAQLLAGKWVYGPISSSTFSSFKSFLSPRQIIGSFFSGGQGPFKKGGTSSIGGQAVIGIIGKGSNQNGTLFVATTGKPFVVKLQAKASSGSGAITFSRYNRPVRPSKPAGAINLQQLGGGS